MTRSFMKIQPGRMLKTVLLSLFRKPATTSYPFEPSPMADRFRGQLKFYPDKCIACKLCMRDCPSGAIVIRKIREGEVEAEIDLGRCIYCGQCVEVCPKKALEMTGEFELAQLDRDKLRIVTRVEHDPIAASEHSDDPAK